MVSIKAHRTFLTLPLFVIFIVSLFAQAFAAQQVNLPGQPDQDGKDKPVLITVTPTTRSPREGEDPELHIEPTRIQYQDRELKSAVAELSIRLESIFKPFPGLLTSAQHFITHFKQVPLEKRDILSTVKDTGNWQDTEFGVAFTVIFSRYDSLINTPKGSLANAVALHNNALKIYHHLTLPPSARPRPITIRGKTQSKLDIEIRGRKFSDTFHRFGDLSRDVGKLLAVEDTKLAAAIDASLKLEVTAFAIFYTRALRTDNLLDKQPGEMAKYIDDTIKGLPMEQKANGAQELASVSAVNVAMNSGTQGPPVTLPQLPTQKCSCCQCWYDFWNWVCCRR